MTPQGEKALVDFADAGDWYESAEYDTTIVEVLRNKLEKIGFSDTSFEQKEVLERLIQESRSNVLLDEWGISNHILMCIAIHPSTPYSIRQALASDTAPSVRAAALLPEL